jgi:transglutaminase-like putative cysteine protease
MKRRMLPKSAHKNQVLTCLVAGLMLCTPFGLQYSLVGQATSSTFLKYEVTDAFAGCIQHNIQIRNPTSQAITDGRLTVPLIGNETAHQYTAIQEVSSTFGQPTILSDSSNNTYAFWENIRISPRDSIRLEVDYQVLSFSSNYIIDPNQTGNYNRDSELYKTYTQPEPLIESGNPNIAAEAQSITSECTSAYDKVVGIYDFVIKHLHYAVQDEERGALWALENGVGDCSEYSYLFVALCRAVGIPARIEAGFVFHYVGESTEDGHMWSEYFLENYGWVPVDATWKLFNSIDYRHFASIQGKPEMTSYANYVFNSTQDSEIEDTQTVYLRPCSASELNSNTFMQDVLKTVQKMRQAQVAISAAKLLGGALIFQSETNESEQSFLESKIAFIEAIEMSDESKLVDSNQETGVATRTAWIVVVKTLVTYCSISIIALVCTLVFLARRSR